MFLIVCNPPTWNCENICEVNMEQVLLLRYGEIYLKGRNRSAFEKCLLDNIRSAIAGIDCRLVRMQGRYALEGFDDSCTQELIDRVTKVFGLHSLSVAYRLPTDLERIGELCASLAADSGTFRITVNRADKSIGLTSIQIASRLGGDVLAAHPALTVDLHNPMQEICVDLRENKTAYVFQGQIPCAGGMPVGCSGKGLALLSGGIDSPVAVYRMAKRGMKVCCVHFHSFPYTSLMAKEKTLDLARILTGYCGDIRVFVVPFTKVQQAIHENCPAEFMITIMRRIMMRIAERLALQNGCGSLTTGESLAQVASQTQESITVTNAVVEHIPVFRPLIGMDKEEIIATARQIGTFETSILPYEDCCTVFLPKNPVIRPVLSVIEQAESALDIESLIADAMAGIEICDIRRER